MRQRLDKNKSAPIQSSSLYKTAHIYLLICVTWVISGHGDLVPILTFASRFARDDAIEVEYTREKLLAELERARQVAEEAKNGSAMAMATLGKAKILGLIIDRREVGDVGAFDHLTDEQLVEEAAKRARMLGIPTKLDS